MARNAINGSLDAAGRDTDISPFAPESHAIGVHSHNRKWFVSLVKPESRYGSFIEIDHD